MSVEHCIPRGAEDRTALLLARVGTLLFETADDMLAGAGVGGRDYSILSILQADGPGSQLELARLLGKAPAIVVSGVDELEARGLVERSRDPADRRRSRVTLTPKGERTLADADVLAEGAVAKLLPGLDAGELWTLKGLLAKGVRFDGAAETTGEPGAAPPQ